MSEAVLLKRRVELLCFFLRSVPCGKDRDRWGRRRCKFRTDVPSSHYRLSPLRPAASWREVVCLVCPPASSGPAPGSAAVLVALQKEGNSVNALSKLICNMLLSRGGLLFLKIGV